MDLIKREFKEIKQLKFVRKYIQIKKNVLQ